MRYQIQRLSFGGIFDASFQLMRDHFVPLTTGFALLYVPLNTITVLLQVDDPTTVSPGRIGLLSLFSLGALVLMPLFQLTATAAIADAYQSHPTSFKSAFGRAKSMYWPYLGTSFLMTIFLMLLAFLLLVPMLYFLVCWSLIGPIGVVEGLFGRKGMARSRALVRGHWWRTLGILLVVGLVSTFASMGFQMIFAFIPVLGGALTGLIGAVSATYGAAVVVVLYIDLRCRHEDFDLQLLAREVAGDRSSRAPAGASRADVASV